MKFVYYDLGHLQCLNSLNGEFSNEYFTDFRTNSQNLYAFMAGVAEKYTEARLGAFIVDKGWSHVKRGELSGVLNFSPMKIGCFDRIGPKFSPNWICKLDLLRPPGFRLRGIELKFPVQRHVHHEKCQRRCGVV